MLIKAILVISIFVVLAAIGNWCFYRQLEKKSEARATIMATQQSV
jgi:hypothetical protein